MRESRGGAFPEARIALCKCPESKNTYAIRMEEISYGWDCTWAFEIREAAAKREGYDTTALKGSLGRTDAYNGCPWCGAKAFVVCSNCQHLCCNVASGNMFTCEWCGTTGELEDYDGAGIASGGDLG